MPDKKPPAPASFDEIDDFDLSQELDDILASFGSAETPASQSVASTQNNNTATNTSVAKVKLPSNAGELEHRKHYRHPVRWRVAVVNKSDGNHDIYHGRTYDVSMFGVTVLVENNISFTSEVVVLLAIPPIHQGAKETIVEIQCQVMHTVLDSQHNQFRLGIKFLHFKRDGENILSDILSKRHIPKEEPSPYKSSKKR